MTIPKLRFLTLAASLATAALCRPALAVVSNDLPANTLTSLWSGVGILSNASGSATGVLIDPSHVLVAAHEVVVAGTHTALPATQVNFKLSSGGTAITASNIALAPGYIGGNPTTIGSTTDYSTADLADLAVVTLSQPINSVATIGYNSGSISELTGGNATIVGFGIGGQGQEDPTNAPFGSKRQAINTIDRVTSGTTTLTGGSNTYKLPSGVVVWDFDQVGAGNGPLGGPALGISEGDAANFDSGGAIFQFDSANNKYLVVGIIDDGTSANSSYGEISWATQTAAYASFLATNTPEPASLASVAIACTMLLSRRRSSAPRP